MNKLASEHGAAATNGEGAERIGEEIHGLMRRLYPICRSITGDGVRRSLAMIREYMPLEIFEVPTGTPIFDWTVPKEWNIRDAYVKNSKGERVIDFQKHNLHLVNYSVPVRRTMSLAELRPHLHTLPEHPDWIPYRASYYKETWGFCLTQRQLEALDEDEYEVCVDSTLGDGSLTYAECYLAGDREDEILLYTHICHPSVCNDNLSGMALLTYLARALHGERRRYSYRFVFAPTTIGSITWLARNESRLGRIKHGLVIALVGDPGPMTYKKSRRGDATVDRAVAHALKHSGRPWQVLDFSPYGYDERQFCSAGIDLPVGRLTRTPNACYPQYHSSADDLDFVRPEFLADSLEICRAALRVLDRDGRYVNLSPKCEPQLGRRGLYNKTSAERDVGQHDLAMLWVLNLCDGRHSLLDIAERSGLAFGTIAASADDLAEAGLLRPAAIGDNE
jgi:aminopeptidase-like protein